MSLLPNHTPRSAESVRLWDSVATSPRCVQNLGFHGFLFGIRLTWAHRGVGAEAAAPRRGEAVEEAVVLPQALTRQGAAAAEGACCWEQAEEQEEVEGLQQESWAQVLL